MVTMTQARPPVRIHSVCRGSSCSTVGVEISREGAVLPWKPVVPRPTFTLDTAVGASLVIRGRVRG